MAANFVVEHNCPSGQQCDISFAGDSVRLAGRIDYPSRRPVTGTRYPLLFLLHHAGCISLETYKPYAQAGLNAGFAVFRWDKRGTGRSGSGGRGSTTQDAVNAYETALHQPNIDRARAVILAQGEGTKMLGSAFGLFARVNQPGGVVLTSNMLDERDVLAINAPLLIVQGEHDWHNPAQYAQAAADEHKSSYPYGADFYVADGADRDLQVGENGRQTFHFGALRQIESWLGIR